MWTLVIVFLSGSTLGGAAMDRITGFKTEDACLAAKARVRIDAAGGPWVAVLSCVVVP